MPRLRVFVSQSTNPWFNLAMEETLFRAMPADQQVLFLWRNADTVVVGRAQNPWKECNTAKMEADSVLLARRQSGGGAVFHDLGNTNFTFMAGKPEYNKSISTSIILQALASLGIEAIATGRNDLVVQTEEGERKFSGSAYRETMDRGFHHGTLLLSADLSRLAQYLNPDPKKLAAKGIESVRARVTNLNVLKADIDHEQVCDAIMAAFFDYHQESVDVELISPDHLPDLPKFAETFEKQRSWEWNFGQSPEFTHSLDERFTWGGVEIKLTVKKGQVEAATIFTDSLDPEPLEFLATQLIGIEYDPENLALICAQVSEKQPNSHEALMDIGHWLKCEVA